MEQNVARHLKQEVAQKEDACSKAIDDIGVSQFGCHLQLRIADVNAVEKRDDVTDEKDGYQTSRNDLIGFCGSAHSWQDSLHVLDAGRTVDASQVSQ